MGWTRTAKITFCRFSHSLKINQLRASVGALHALPLLLILDLQLLRTKLTLRYWDEGQLLEIMDKKRKGTFDSLPFGFFNLV